MVLDIIRIIEHNTYENKSIIMTIDHQPLKGEKGEPVRRFMMGKFQTKGFQQWAYHQEASLSKNKKTPIDSWDKVKGLR